MGFIYYLIGIAVGYWLCNRKIRKAGLCTKHLVKLKLRGYHDEEYCEVCWDETQKTFRPR